MAGPVDMIKGDLSCDSDRVLDLLVSSELTSLKV